MWVQATDNNAVSGKTYLTILIDAIKVDDIGYLIDIDGDGIYDVFENLDGGLTKATNQTDGTYLIDTDGDNDWDLVYDPQTGTSTDYSSGPSEETTQEDNAIWYALLIGMIITMLVILIIFLATKKKKGKK